ncbi:transposable element Tcb2 transposase [Trichonephila clavipes]|nr:transposable element Tcb2 transposase [Trichonephila clavipes]
MWNVTYWQKVVFIDKSRFVMGTDDNRARVWRRPGPFLNGLPGAIFQQDNARPHTARVAQDFLRHFQTLPWPARSPDLSPVVRVWDQLKRQMPSCHSVHDLELAVQDLWVHLPQANISARYIYGVLRPVTLPFIRALRNPTFQPDLLVAGIVWTFLDTKNVRLFSWPAHSSDLSATEKVWSMARERLARNDALDIMVDELGHCEEAAWASVPVHVMQSLFDSIPRRLSAVIIPEMVVLDTNFSGSTQSNVLRHQSLVIYNII